MCYRLAAFGSLCQWTRIFIFLTTPIAIGTQLCFIQHRESHSSSRKLRFRRYYQSLFLQVALHLRPPLRVLEMHINGIRRIIIHISYSENHDWTQVFVFYYFYMSPLPTYAHIIAKGAFKRHRKYHHSSQRPEKL